MQKPSFNLTIVIKYTITTEVEIMEKLTCVLLRNTNETTNFCWLTINNKQQLILFLSSRFLLLA